MKRPPGLFLLLDRSTTPALRSWCSQADRLMRSERDIRCWSRICLRSGCGLRILFEVPAGIWGKPHPIDVGFNGAFPDVVVTEEDLIAEGDKVVERSSAMATHKGALMGEPPTNKTVRWSEIHIYRLQDGRIAEHWAEIAMIELLQQTGVLPTLG